MKLQNLSEKNPIEVILYSSCYKIVESLGKPQMKFILKPKEEISLKDSNTCHLKVKLNNKMIWEGNVPSVNNKLIVIDPENRKVFYDFDEIPCCPERNRRGKEKISYFRYTILIILLFLIFFAYRKYLY